MDATVVKGRSVVAAWLVAALVAAAVWSPGVMAQPGEGSSAKKVLTDDQWRAVDRSVSKGLSWLAGQQQPDGSFPTGPDVGQPGVTSLCVLAFAAHGQLPGEGPHGQKLEKAVQYIAASQKRNGLLARVASNSPTLTRNGSPYEAVYNHGISGLALAEVYGMTGELGGADGATIIPMAIQATLTMQGWDKRRAADKGGWRYLQLHNLDEEPFDSDLSVSGWQLMFLRSAKNAGFDVPAESIDAAVGYVRRCFSDKYGAFQLMATDYDRRSRGMAGAGVLALAHAGFHKSEEARRAGDWILERGFEDYNEFVKFGPQTWVDDRYHYGVFNCAQAMYQLGGKYWEQFFPPTAMTLVKNQRADGSWEPESHSHDMAYGSCYTTALVALTLGAPNQLLPIFQR